MELISSKADPDDFFLEPIEYVFQTAEGEWTVSFIPTVPHGCEAEVLHGDLFGCRVRDITYDTIPVAIGSDSEQRILAKLQAFADLQKTKDEQLSLRFDNFPKMTGEMVGWRQFLWFIAAITHRSGRDRP